MDPAPTVDGALTLRDGRTLAWHEWGVADGTPVLRLQGTPGSRLSRHPRLDLWQRLGLRVVMADRPGFGRSTRLPGRGVTAVADDLVELLDHLGLEDVPVVGQSGGGAHVLGLCARHPERVRAATVVVGAAPLTDADLPHLVGLNAEAHRRIRTGGWSSLHALLAEQRLALLADPLAGFRAAMQGAPDSDWAVMADPAWHDTFAQGVREALRPGAEGWADESLALLTEWDFAPEEVSTPIVWWHARHDANVPLQAVERVTARLPSVDLRVWDGRGHPAPNRTETAGTSAICFGLTLVFVGELARADDGGASGQSARSLSCGCPLWLCWSSCGSFSMRVSRADGGCGVACDDTR